MLLVSLREEDIIRTSPNSSNAAGLTPAGDNCVDNIFKPSSIS